MVVVWLCCAGCGDAGEFDGEVPHAQKSPLGTGTIFSSLLTFSYLKGLVVKFPGRHFLSPVAFRIGELKCLIDISQGFH